ncbi:MAG: metallophosphoesterase [Acidobacteriota bacterium]
MEKIIAHISDLHLSTTGAWKTFELAAADIAAFKPSIIVVTGDLVDNPVESDLSKVKVRLEKLCEDCSIEDPTRNLIVIPGNHDYRWSGLFGEKSIENSAFNHVFRNWERPRLINIEGRHLTFFCMDSNATKDPRISLAHGRVGESGYARLSADYLKMQEDHPEIFAESFKIALLHHHPLPIADTEIDSITDKDVFLSLEDAGTFMREVVEKRIDLILHGHKHYPFFSRIKFVTAAYGEREVTVIGAGSASKPGKHGNGFNLIRFKTDGTVESEQWQRRTGGFRKLQGTPVMDYEGFRNRSHEEALRAAHTSKESEIYSLFINEYGDCRFEEKYEGFRVHEGKPPVDAFPVDNYTETGTYRAFQSSSASSKIADPRWVPDEDSSDRRTKGKLFFSRPVDSSLGSINFDVSYWCFNSFALTLEQHRRMYGDDDPESYTCLIKRPIERLLIEIHFPFRIEASGFEVLVQDEEDNHNLREENWCRRHLRVSDTIVSFDIPKPLVNYNYGISWQLPSVSEYRKKGFHPSVEGKAALIRNKLLRSTLSVSDSPLNSILAAMRQEILEKYPSHDDAERFEVGLMVYDETIHKLRHVAGIYPPEYKDWLLFEGEGVNGRAHKLNQAILYVRSRVSSDEDWYSSPPEVSAAHNAVFAVPLRYPLDRKDGWVIGVLGLASTSPSSGLLDLYDNDRKASGLIELIYVKYFLEQIIPAIGL